MRFRGALACLALFAAAAGAVGDTAIVAEPSRSDLERGDVPRDVRMIWAGPSDARRVALTFDDGPRPEITARILDLLADAHAHATFFLVGERVASSGDAGRAVLHRMLAEGHEIGNHTWSHADVARLSQEQVLREVARTQDAIERFAGIRPTLFRPPGGGVDFRAVRSLASTGMEAVVMWTIDPSDWAEPGREKIWENVAAHLAPGSIILLHDIHRETLEALPVLLDLIQARGYEIVTVSELVRASKP